MKRIIFAMLIALCFFGCSSHSNYKKSAVEYLKTKVPNSASVDTIKFIKPDSIYTTFYDTDEYRALRKGYNRFEIAGDSIKAAEITNVINQRIKNYKKVVVGWDVRLIYKAKDKMGVIKTDTCRFTFDSRLAIVKDLNGVDL